MSQENSEPRGVYAAVATPLTKAYTPDVAKFIDHCRWLLQNGCDGLAPLGTTGEANSLSVNQRLELIEGIRESGLPPKAFIIGGGSCSLADAVTLSARITEIGADGVLLLPPFYYKNPSDDALFAFFSEVVQKVGSSQLRVYLYHIPPVSQIPISLSLISRLKSEFGAVVAGVKDSSGDFRNTVRMISEIPDFVVFSGSEEFLLKNLLAGGAGCISASTNVTCRLARELYLNHRSEKAWDLQENVSRLRRSLEQFPMQAAVKEALATMNKDPSWRTILPPNQELTGEQRRKLSPILGELQEAERFEKSALS
jgi:4-hydroxy-tetrahydrodipicolinate synthase